MAKCWEMRGCDDEMMSNCPHPNELQDRCPTKCAFANCQRPTHEITSDPELIFDPGVDRETAIKDICMYCDFFLRNGPRVSAAR